MRESRFQSELIKKLKKCYPGCIVLKNDSDYLQGIPDLLVLYKKRWAMLEVKASEDSPTQPNQEHYIWQANHMSFGAFIYPENEEEVLNALQQTFEPRRQARVSVSQ